MSKPVYFVTGGAGLLGRHLVKAVYDHDPRAELRLLVRGTSLPPLPNEMLDRVRFVWGDLTQPDTYSAALDGVQTVIHSAALISFKPADREAIYRTNVVGTRALLQAAAANGCHHFIYISSISAIGRQPPQPADESLLPDREALVRDPYAHSKVMAESEVLRYVSTMHVTILNPSVIIGPGSRRWQRAFRWLRRLPTLPMLPTMNSFVDARDVARAVLLAQTGLHNGERYIVTAENVDMVTFTRLALRVLESRAPVFPVPASLIRVGDAAIVGLDRLGLNPGIKRLSELNIDKSYCSQKIRRVLGWAPTYTLQQSIADTLAPLASSRGIGG